MKMENYDNREYTATGRWCCSDLRDDDSEKLDELLKSMAPFRVEISVAHEINYASIIREDWNGDVDVWVTVETDEYGMDGDYGLIDDAVWAVYNEEKELSDDDLESISDELSWYGIQTEFADGITLKKDATLQDVMDTLDRFENELTKAAEDEFERVKNIVKDYIESKGDEEK